MPPPHRSPRHGGSSRVEASPCVLASMIGPRAGRAHQPLGASPAVVDRVPARSGRRRAVVLAYLDQLQPVRLDLIEQPAEGGLVGDHTVERGLERYLGQLEPVESRAERWAQPAADPDLV